VEANVEAVNSTQFSGNNRYFLTSKKDKFAGN
jgi:hypothetical protein